MKRYCKDCLHRNVCAYKEDFELYTARADALMRDIPNGDRFEYYVSCRNFSADMNNYFYHTKREKAE